MTTVNMDMSKRLRADVKKHVKL